MNTIFLTDAAPGLCNISFDLETFGTRPGCALRSIGAVFFDPHSMKIGAEFYANISEESCRVAGLHIDPETVAWWSKQSQQARDALAVNPLTVTEAAVKFDDWWRKNGGIFVWSHGANFDEPIWSAAMHAVGRKVPWKFWDSRCTRTAYDLAGFDPRSVRRSGTYHNALDDAQHQALCVQKAYAKVRALSEMG
jgi:hypothetical protein